MSDLNHEIKENFRLLMGNLSIEEIVSNHQLREQLKGIHAVLMSI